MRRTTFITVLALLVAAAVAPMSATATQSPQSQSTVVYKNAGTDARDLKRTDALDLRRSIRAVVRIGGHRYLSISTRGERSFKRLRGGEALVVARLDTRGGAGADYVLQQFLGSSGNDIAPTCLLGKTINSMRYIGRLHFRKSGAIACKVRMTKMRVSHRISWRLTSGLRGASDITYFDQAPNHGWYS